MAVIFIVEDDVFIREIAKLMIEDWGHNTLSASDIDEALSLLRSPQHVDALFTDICLKTAVLGGCELAHHAIKLRPKLDTSKNLGGGYRCPSPLRTFRNRTGNKPESSDQINTPSSPHGSF
jgi:CheY-like chemotaxis protein